jgi:hypothetical protein
LREGLEGATLRLGDASSTQPDLAAARSGEIAAVWSEFHEGGVLRHALSIDAGSTWSMPESIDSADASASHPLVVPTPDGFRVFWTETPDGKPSQWRSQALVVAP